MIGLVAKKELVKEVKVKKLRSGTGAFSNPIEISFIMSLHNFLLTSLLSYMEREKRKYIKFVEQKMTLCDLSIIINYCTWIYSGKQSKYPVLFVIFQTIMLPPSLATHPNESKQE